MTFIILMKVKVFCDNLEKNKNTKVSKYKTFNKTWPPI